MSFKTDVIWCDAPQSTMDELGALVTADSQAGLCVASTSQRRARGRRNRSWVTADNLGVGFSVLLEGDHTLSIPVAVAVCGQLRSWGAPAGIKWPNDILIKERKVCGILLESTANPRLVNVGIGLNLAETPNLPEEIETQYVGLNAYRHESSNLFANDVVGPLRAKLQEVSAMWIGGQKDAVLKTWREADMLYEKRIALDDGRSGVAKGIDNDGRLLVEMGGRMERVLSGEVSVTWC